jgi:type IV pilus assembly protein PilO
MTSNLRKIIFFVLLLGLSYVAYVKMIKPANKDLADKKAKVELQLAKLSEFAKMAAATDNLNKQLSQVQDAITFFESKLPPTSEMDKVLRDVTVIAEKQGLQSKIFQALKKKDNNGHVEQPLKMELSGNFNSYYSFILEIEKLPRIMKIRELTIKKSAKEDGLITANFIVSIFFNGA